MSHRQFRPLSYDFLFPLRSFFVLLAIMYPLPHLWPPVSHLNFVGSMSWIVTGRRMIVNPQPPTPDTHWEKENAGWTQRVGNPSCEAKEKLRGVPDLLAPRPTSKPGPGKCVIYKGKHIICFGCWSSLEYSSTRGFKWMSITFLVIVNMVYKVPLIILDIMCLY